MTEEQKQSDGGVPPKLNLQQSETGAAPAVPAAGAPVPAQPTQVLSPAAKKQTTRIELSALQGAPAGGTVKKATSKLVLTGADAQPTAKTIRVTPAPSKTAAPESAPPTGRLVPADENVKSKTSRIPLEAAITPAGEEAAEAGTDTSGVPKTIRIKRPGQPSTMRVAKPGAGAESLPESAATAKTKTSQIDVSTISGEAAAGQATQRKTIKIRRPDGALKPAPRSMQVARLEAEIEASAAETEEGPGIVFSIIALAAVVVAAVMLYALVAQVAPGLGLSLPGKIAL